MKLAIFYNRGALQDAMIVLFSDRRAYRVDSVSRRPRIKALLNNEGRIRPTPQLIEELVNGGHIEAVQYEPSFIVGTILKIESLEGTKLAKCYVHVGEGKKYLSVVCGATNLSAGARVVVATAGTVMPDGTIIETAEIAGEKSEGMLCSAAELGLTPGQPRTILILDSKTPPGLEYVPESGATPVAASEAAKTK